MGGGTYDGTEEVHFDEKGEILTPYSAPEAAGSVGSVEVPIAEVGVPDDNEEN